MVDHLFCDFSFLWIYILYIFWVFFFFVKVKMSKYGSDVYVAWLFIVLISCCWMLRLMYWSHHFSMIMWYHDFSLYFSSVLSKESTFTKIKRLIQSLSLIILCKIKCMISTLLLSVALMYRMLVFCKINSVLSFCDCFLKSFCFIHPRESIVIGVLTLWFKFLVFLFKANHTIIQTNQISENCL